MIIKTGQEPRVEMRWVPKFSREIGFRQNDVAVSLPIPAVSSEQSSVYITSFRDPEGRVTSTMLSETKPEVQKVGTVQRIPNSYTEEARDIVAYELNRVAAPEDAVIERVQIPGLDMTEVRISFWKVEL